MSKEKLKIYSPIKEEAGVIMLFSKLHEQLGFPKLVASSSRGFDINSIEYKDNTGTYNVTVEFEFVSSNFLVDRHIDAMQPNRKYIVICWEDDCTLQKLIYSRYEKSVYKVIELKKYVDIIPYTIDENYNEPEYYLINYNPKNCDGTPFINWINANIFRFSNNNNIKVKNGSKALIKQGDYIIGGFDIVRFENIKLTDNEVKLYKQLTNYPVSLFDMSEEEITNEYVNNNIGHIFYNYFFELGYINLRKTIKEVLPDLNITRGAIQRLTEEQYNKLLGIK